MVQTRAVTYPFREDAHHVSRRPGDSGRGPYRTFDDPGGRGYETVKELAMCPRCAEQARADRAA